MTGINREAVARTALAASPVEGRIHSATGMLRLTRSTWGRYESSAEGSPAALAPRGGLWIRGDGLEVHLGVEKDFRPAREAHPGIRVRNLDGLALHLDHHDVAVAWDNENFPGRRRFYCNDPVGNRLEFIERDI